METDHQLRKRIPVEAFATDTGLESSELVSLILDGKLAGERHGNRRYVAAPLVTLIPDGFPDGSALLRVSACRISCYLTAGRGELGIPLRFADFGRPAALVALQEALDRPVVLPVEIHLNREYFLIDSSLWVDFSAALIEFQTLTDPPMQGVV